ncbi:MAG: hypothetical protein ABIG03_01940 [Candidatus Eisenbacteria bacterium]
MRRFAIAFAVLMVAAMVVPALAQDFYYEFPTPGRGYDPTWPTDGDTWHQLYPTYCQYDTQTGHDDADGNGTMDVCEHIFFDGERHHIEWVGPTFRLVYMGAPPEGRPPVLDKFVEDAPLKDRQYSYHEIYPVFCNIIETTEPITNECQEIWIEFPPEDVGWWHVQKIETNIRTVPDPVNPVEQSTWGKIKSWFGDLF